MWTLALTLALLSPAPDEHPTVAHWALDGTLESAVGGASLVVEPAGAFVDGLGRRVLSLPPGSVVKVPLAFDQRGPGYLGRWAVLMDVRAAVPTAARPAAGPRRSGPERASDTAKSTKKGPRAAWTEVPLVQTDPANLDGAEMTMSSTRGLEVASQSAGQITPDGWHRVAMIVDEHDGTVTGFIDGVMTRRVKTTVTDSRWALEPELLLFTDKGRGHPGLEVAGVQVRVGRVGPAWVEELGGSDKPLPWPDTTTLGWRRPPPSSVSAGLPFSVSFFASPPSGEVVLSWRPEAGAARVLSRAAADSGRILAVVPSDGVGELELVWEGVKRQRLASPLTVRAAAEAPTVGQELVTNAELEPQEGALSGWRVAGTIALSAGTVSGRDGDYALTQVVPLPPGLATGGFGFTASVRMKRAERASALGDRGLLVVRWRDRAGAVLATAESLGADSERWHERTVLGPIPEGAVEAEVVFQGFERHGDKNGIAVDRIGLVARALDGRALRISKSPLVLARGAAELALIFETDGADVTPQVEVLATTGPIALTSTTVDPRHVVHVAPLPAAPEGEVIRYRVRLGDEVSPTWEVVSPKVAGALRMGWIADNQHGWQTFRTLVPQLSEAKIDFLFAAGDFVQHGYKLREWQTEWFSPLSIDGFGQRTPIMVARGNHDANGALAHAYAPLPGNGHWFAFSRNGVRFIVLDTEADTTRAPAQLRWLADELASDASRYAELRVVTFHKPPFSNRWHSAKSTYDGESWVRQHFVPLFTQYKVDLVVSGHAHAYQRRDHEGVRYVVVGGAGGALDRYKTGRWPMTVDYVGHHYAVMDVSDRRLSWVAKDFGGEVIDSFELTSKTRHLGR